MIYVAVMFVFVVVFFVSDETIKSDSDTDQKLIFTNFDKLLNFRSSDNRLLS